MSPLTQRAPLATLLLACLLGGGCSSTGEVTGDEARPLFYPLPPAQPRIQYLQTIASAKDVGDVPSDFERWVTGKEADDEGFQLMKPYGVAFFDQKMWVCDPKAGPIGVFDPVDHKARPWRPENQGVIFKAANVAFGPDGERYVTDQGRKVTLVYDAAGGFLRALGDPKTERPLGLAVGQDHVFVSDLEQHQVHVYDRKTGEKLRSIGSVGSKPGQFYWPVNLALDPEGNLLVVDMLNCRVQRFTPEGERLQVFGSRGRSIGQFVRPKGIACDRSGRIYVTDAAFENVQIFNPEGKVLLFFGSPGTGDGSLSMPAQVTVSEDPGVLALFRDRVAKDRKITAVVAVTSQFGPRKVNVYGLLEVDDQALVRKAAEAKARREGETRKHPRPGAGKEPAAAKSPGDGR